MFSKSHFKFRFQFHFLFSRIGDLKRIFKCFVISLKSRALGNPIGVTILRDFEREFQKIALTVFKISNGALEPQEPLGISQFISNPKGATILKDFAREFRGINARLEYIRTFLQFTLQFTLMS